ncbi:MAG: ABC transporter permease [Bacillota bacterium]
MEGSFLVTLQGILGAAVRMAAPLLFASMGGLFSARSGMVSMFLDGFMLVGAFMGFVGSVVTGSAYLGALLAMLAGAFIALVFAFLAIEAKANQTILGVGVNIFALGITSYLVTILYGFGNRPYNISVFTEAPIPLLSEIPIIGGLFSNTLLVYLAFLLVPAVWYVLYRTPTGLTIRATGEHPKAVDTLGGNVVRVRYLCMLVAGALAGLGGASLSIGQMGQFMENITSGKGYIALAALIFGKFTPKGVLIAALIFGFADGLQMRMQSAGSTIPYQFLTMLPYVITIVALITFSRKSSAPAALGRPYNRQG